MKFIDKAIEHVIEIFPSIYEEREKRGSYHFAMAFSRSKLIAVGLNDNVKVNAKAYKLAKQFNLEHQIKYPFKHAETSLVSRLISMRKLDPSYNIVVLRLNIRGELCESKPCSNCSILLSAYGFRNIYWSNSRGEISEDR